MSFKERDIDSIPLTQRPSLESVILKSILEPYSGITPASSCTYVLFSNSSVSARSGAAEKPENSKHVINRIEIDIRQVLVFNLPIN